MTVILAVQAVATAAAVILAGNRTWILVVGGVFIGLDVLVTATLIALALHYGVPPMQSNPRNGHPSSHPD